MFKTKLIFGMSIALAISLFANIALGFNVSNAANVANQKEKEIEKLKQNGRENSNLQIDEKTTLSTDVDLNNTRILIEKFFKAQFEYNTNTYKDRFTKIKEFVNNEVYGQLTAAGIPETPGIKFENKIKDLQIYFNPELQGTSGLVVLESKYTVDKIRNPPTTQIYRVSVGKENGQYKITSLELLGTFTAMKES